MTSSIWEILWATFAIDIRFLGDMKYHKSRHTSQTLEKFGRPVSDLHRESLSTYRLDNGLECILDASRTTSRPTFSRFCEK